jgi:recombination protein RecA
MTVYTNGTNPATRQLDQALRDLRRRFGSEAIRPASELQPAEVIPTGFPTLDEALGIGGLPRGRIVDVYGPESAGKTTLCLHVIAEAQKQGGQAAIIDAEHKLDPAWARRRGVDLARLMVVRPDTFEQGLEITAGLVRSGAVSVIVIDSTAALVPKAEADGEMGDSHNHHGALMSQACRKLAGPAWKTKTLLIFISQVRQKIGVMFGNPEVATGGNALRFYATIRLDVRRVQAVKERNETVGALVRVVVKKNQLAAPFKTAEFELYYDGRR